ncbi:hypothetical protein [Chlamydiifrater volucris]|uniref:hypothetical protein n=1 Tax=Chlamydiifrater volucris TaxID=2681470 RepID=UPI001BCD93ED|nr:hypothetical protein [Chlamydiifrater volucris]
MVGIITRNTADYVEQKRVELGEIDFFSPRDAFCKPILKVAWSLCRDAACLAEAAKQNERNLPPLLVKDIEGVLIQAGSVLYASWEEEDLGFLDKCSVINELKAAADRYEQLKIELEDSFHVTPSSTPGRYEKLLKEPTQNRAKKIFRLVASVIAVLAPVVTSVVLMGLGVITGALPIAFAVIVCMFLTLFPAICLVKEILALKHSLKATSARQSFFINRTA